MLVYKYCSIVKINYFILLPLFAFFLGFTACNTTSKLMMPTNEGVGKNDTAYFSNNPLSDQELRCIYYDYREYKKDTEKRDSTANEINVLQERLMPFKSASNFENNSLVKYLDESLTRLKNCSPGMTIPNFALPDTCGRIVELAQIYPKHKITIINFWASWCGPCMRYNNELKNVYDKYKSNGLEIVSISTDRDEDRWKNAIDSYKQNWVHVAESKGWEADILNLYQISAIPFNIVIGRDGKILKILSVPFEDLGAFLNSFFK